MPTFDYVFEDGAIGMAVKTFPYKAKRPAISGTGVNKVFENPLGPFPVSKTEALIMIKGWDWFVDSNHEDKWREWFSLRLKDSISQENISKMSLEELEHFDSQVAT